MLTSLSIRDIVLIERLDLELGSGLCVLTGETGAGKSILLDSLGLALGGRADRGLLRAGAKKGSVSAVFQLSDAVAIDALLEEHGIDGDDQLLLRRTLGQDGRSRAFINDQAVGTALLKRLGELLVEVHGQHDQQGLLDPSTQRGLVDAYGKLGSALERVRTAHADWRDAVGRLRDMEEEVARAAVDIDYWRHVLGELDELAAEVGEEERLAEARARLMNREKLIGAIEEALSALSGDGGLATRLGKAERSVERVLEMAGEVLEPAAAALDRLRVELDETTSALDQAGRTLAGEDGSLEEIEERLFALRAAARKHKLKVDDLPAFREQTAAKLARLDASDEHLAEARAAADRARQRLVEAAAKLTAGRQKAADALTKAVMKELPPLKLEKARFVIRLMPRPDGEIGENGAERVLFEVATNPGQKPGPLGKIASGGELARLMLALKVSLAMTEALPSLVFDEVDSGVGGATADAVGDRLERLGQFAQVLVVTHAPQVAARAGMHLRVQKVATRG
ncbi:MAG: DNA repair protein RecN, partial [Alphaproteobacteria bacterium]|nr:DNA repair protein RecN [Alphaproteobacteria bacterium]